MQPFSFEETIAEGSHEVKNLFEFVRQNADVLNSYEIENTILKKAMNICLAAMRGYFAVKGTGDVGMTLLLDDGTVLKKDSQLREKTLSTIFGKLSVPRTYYHVRGHKGVSPLDAEANLPKRRYSYFLQELMDKCDIRESFGESKITLGDIFGLEISQSCYETVNRESSESYEEVYAKTDIPDPASEGEITGIGFDGKGVPIIKSEAAKLKSRLGKGEKRQKTKEATVGVSFTADRKIRKPEEVAENLIYPEKAGERKKKLVETGESAPPSAKAKNIRRVASLERTRADVMNEIVTDAKKRNPENNRPWVVVMDGALGLWKTAAATLEGINWTGVLDIIHVVEYLWKVGNSLHGERTPEAKKWVFKHLLSILRGRVGYVIGGLRQTLKKREKTLKDSQKRAIMETIKYFENHREWMKYNKYLEKGYPIGSGIVESTCGHTVKKRMEGTGRRWSIRGAEAMLRLRSVYTSDDWAAYWREHMRQGFMGLYGRTLNSFQYSDDYYKVWKEAA
ncbi:MAG: ISKra4 family transposase [bacterium]|nr:ISKra4 family transposase [bacterium]